MNKTIKKIILSIISLLAIIILFIIGYAIYILVDYYRIEDNLIITVEGNSSYEEVGVDKQLTISTYNIGFGAYSQDYTFFLDEGIRPDGSTVTGKYSKGKSKEEVLFNTTGAIRTIKELNTDFCLFQEVDTSSTRSYHINQYQMIKDNFDNYQSTFAVNFHSAFLPYPLNDMHGSVNAGIATLSKYQITSSVRKSFTVATDLSKLFDLDRCFSINEIKTNNNNILSIVNVHMSAYDEGGKIRQKQLEELNSYLSLAKEKGYYVIVGGDFNHDLITYNPLYEYDLKNDKAFLEYISFKKPNWLQMFFNDDSTTNITSGYTVVAADNAPTTRDPSIEWKKGTGYVAVIDGFIVSDNIEIIDVKNIITKNGNKGVNHFAYSDHEPALLKFKLRK